jgi:hypothetical protein
VPASRPPNQRAGNSGGRSRDAQCDPHNPNLIPQPPPAKAKPGYITTTTLPPLPPNPKTTSSSSSPTSLLCVSRRERDVCGLTGARQLTCVHSNHCVLRGNAEIPAVEMSAQTGRLWPALQGCRARCCCNATQGRCWRGTAAAAVQDIGHCCPL